jgi:murein L,D-transpeptidase YcbB/YkuD
MTTSSARLFLIATGIVMACAIVPLNAAEREYPPSRLNAKTSSPFEKMDGKRKRSYLSDYLTARRQRADGDPASPDVRRKRAQRALPAQAAYPTNAEQPEPPLVYQPEKLETLSIPDLAQPPALAPLAAAVFDELRGNASAIRVTAGEKQALVDFYRLNSFKPVWVSPEGIDQRARAVLRFLAGSGEDGMSPDDYLPPSLAGFEADAALVTAGASRLARLDIELSARALRYARHASGGRLLPNKLTLYHDITPPTVDLAKAMQVFAWSPFPAEYLEGLQPRHPAYGKLKTALAELRELRAGPGSGLIATGSPVQPGQNDVRVPLLRQYLAWLGYGETGDSSTLDSALSDRLTLFQKDARLKPTGMLDRATTAAFNSRNSNGGVDQLIYNLERLRWLPRHLGERYVFVNQPAYELQVVDKDREIWRTKVIIGKTTSQTYAFSDTMETVVFNPSWGVPPSIMKNEMLPRLKRDPSYLDRIGYRVLTPDGKIVHSRSIRWSQFKDTVPYLVQQPPSDDNAMGEIKFLFPNAHSIYMHDTPGRSLFGRSTRAMSHGCVRVEDPRKFAEMLLGLDAADVAAAIDSGESRTSKVTQKTQVHLAYFTIWPAQDGRLLYYDDVYGRDERMQRAFTTMAVASR